MPADDEGPNRVPAGRYGGDSVPNQFASVCAESFAPKAAATSVLLFKEALNVRQCVVQNLPCFGVVNADDLLHIVLSRFRSESIMNPCNIYYAVHQSKHD